MIRQSPLMVFERVNKPSWSHLKWFEVGHGLILAAPSSCLDQLLFQSIFFFPPLHLSSTQNWHLPRRHSVFNLVDTYGFRLQKASLVHLTKSKWNNRNLGSLWDSTSSSFQTFLTTLLCVALQSLLFPQCSLYLLAVLWFWKHLDLLSRSLGDCEKHC